MSNITTITAFATPVYAPAPRARVLASTVASETGARQIQGTTASAGWSLSDSATGNVFAGAAAAKADLGHRTGVDMGTEPTQGTHVWSPPPLR